MASTATIPPKGDEEIRVEQVSSEADVAGMFECMSASFGDQTHDAFWIATHPNYTTAQGKADGIARLVQRWHKQRESGYTWFLKAVVMRDGVEHIGGITIWTELLHPRNPPPNDVHEVMDVGALYPDDEAQQLCLRQMYSCFTKRRREVVREAGDRPIMVLDVCCVHPAFQRRGLARKMVQWGLDKAAESGGRECFTEASVMGRPQYEKLGFVKDSMMSWDGLDPQFSHLRCPVIAHLRRPLNAAQ